MAIAKDELGKILRDNAASREILQTEAEECKSSDLKDLLPYGIGIHHAGLAREDREMIEGLFEKGHI